MHALVEEAFLDRDEQGVGEHTEGDVRLHAVLEVVEDRCSSLRLASSWPRV
jgi:hypothetical protein